MHRRPARSLLEVLVAVVMLGLVAALTLPRFGSAAASPDDTTLLRDRLRVLRIAIERYHQDHGVYPAMRGDGHYPAGTAGAFVSQLCAFTDADGLASDRRSERFCFGPYLRDGVPPCPAGAAPASSAVYVRSAGGEAAPTQDDLGGDVLGRGWVYDPATGQISAATTAVDAAGRPYATY